MASVKPLPTTLSSLAPLFVRMIPTPQLSLKNAQANAAKFESHSKELSVLRNQNVAVREAPEKASQADRAERDAAIKEAAELKGQLEAIKNQNQELLDKLSK